KEDQDLGPLLGDNIEPMCMAEAPAMRMRTALIPVLVGVRERPRPRHMVMIMMVRSWPKVGSDAVCWQQGALCPQHPQADDNNEEPRQQREIGFHVLWHQSGETKRGKDRHKHNAAGVRQGDEDAKD